MSDPFPCTELGNAERLAAWHGDDIRHVTAWGWLVWTGKVWRRSDKLAAERAKRTVRQIYRSAADCQDENRRKALSLHAAASEARSRIVSMLALAESDPKISAETSDFDRDPLLLNVRNGTIDLRTGRLREHQRGDLITKLVELDFNLGAHSELWDRFLEKATEGKDGLLDFLCRAAGYTLTGSTEEDAIFVPHGPAGTGKTTFVETLKAALGPYAGSIRIETLTSSTHSSGGHNEDVARLVGLRMVTAVEASENERLREGQVKHMTGGDTIPASLKHKPAFDYVPVFKLWLATNEVPYIRSDDTGMWRRLHKLPFNNRHPKSTVKDELKRKAHLAAVLAWAVQGCLEWQQHGLQVPECVGAATSDLRRHMDGLPEFFTECCDFSNPNQWTAAKAIRAAYTEWAAAQGIPEVRRPDDRHFARALRQKGCEADLITVNEDKLRCWWGIRVLPQNSWNSKNGNLQFSLRTRAREEKPAVGVPSVLAVPAVLERSPNGCTHGLTSTAEGVTTCIRCGKEVPA